MVPVSYQVTVIMISYEDSILTVCRDVTIVFVRGTYGEGSTTSLPIGIRWDVSGLPELRISIMESDRD